MVTGGLLAALAFFVSGILELKLQVILNKSETSYQNSPAKWNSYTELQLACM